METDVVNTIQLAFQPNFLFRISVYYLLYIVDLSIMGISFLKLVWSNYCINCKYAQKLMILIYAYYATQLIMS